VAETTSAAGAGLVVRWVLAGYSASLAVTGVWAAGFQRGAVAVFHMVDEDDTFLGAAVGLYEFADDSGARTYAELLANRMALQADSRSPAPVPSVEELRGAVIGCDVNDESCQRAGVTAGVAVESRFLVAVEVVNHGYPPASELLAQVEEVLRAQLDQL
jgi:hypothetical protein